MKKIKRTTIKITRRELIVVNRSEGNQAQPIQKCPTCHFPLSGQTSFPAEEKTPPQLLESNANYNK